MVMVKIINHNSEIKTYGTYSIGAGATLELPKEDAKAFIRTFEGVDWIRTATPAEDKKKETLKSPPPIVKSTDKVGERGDI